MKPVIYSEEQSRTATRSLSWDGEREKIQNPNQVKLNIWTRKIGVKQKEKGVGEK